MKEIRLAVIPGDGIGKETVAAGKNVLDAVADVRGGSASGTSSSIGAANITRSTDG